ncbi:putative ABC1 protein [Acorus calamus]|uniref:ABC1 protein n=1 Tax=Acorus calamus TaxID=4465 RepID=A0AAV9CFG0_ACOCL|nr:putative ABC1 protein [Acorus calamus]
MKIDITTMSILSNFISWVFPDYRFDWAVLEFEKTISMELDFVQEAKNSERTAKNFKKKKFIRVPRVYWDLTTKQVLTMQFCDGHKVDDVEYLKEIGINPAKVAKALVELFAEMIFVHGFLHGDPHPGNILVSAEGHRGFSLVLLDHGIYKELDNGFRLDYCQLWKSLILLDSHKIQDLGEKFGVGKYSRYFPVIFMGRTIDSKSAIGREMSLEEKSKLKHELKLLKMDDISSFMESLPTDFLAILRADGHLRSIISKLGAPQHVRLLSYAKYAVYGLTIEPNTQSGFFTKYTHTNFKSSVNYLHLRAFLEIMELLLRIEDLGHSLAKKWRRIIFNVILFCKGRLFALTI